MSEQDPIYETNEGDLAYGDWRDELEGREQNEVKLAEYYTTVLGHGTDGHLKFVTIAKMAAILDRYEAEIKDLLEEE